MTIKTICSKNHFQTFALFCNRLVFFDNYKQAEDIPLVLNRLVETPQIESSTYHGQTPDDISHYLVVIFLVGRGPIPNKDVADDHKASDIHQRTKQPQHNSCASCEEGADVTHIR